MNFYKRHLGDIAKACGHLSQGEMGAYDLMMDWCYSNERPLPKRIADLYRIGRAATKAERANVDRVLADFFVLTDDGYTQKRVLEEIAKANAQAETNRAIAEAREAARRARREHESCNESSKDRSTKGQPSQTPDTRLQTKALTPASAPTTPTRATAPTEPGRACVLMRQSGCTTTNPSHPDLVAAIAEGVTPEALADAATEAVDAGKRQPFAYAIALARGRHRDGPKPPGGSHEQPRARRESLAERVTRKAIESERAHQARTSGDDGPVGEDDRALRAPLDVDVR